MEHIIIETLSNGLFRLRAEDGYKLYNIYTSKYHSEAEVLSVDGFIAVLDGVSPEPHERTLEDAKKEKLAALKAYDASTAVNEFTLNGVTMWISPADRSNYMLTIEGAQRQGMSSVPFLGQTIPVNDAMSMLDAVNIYAMQCVGVTQAHEIAINALSTISAVDNYDFTVGYPQKLSF